MSTFKGIVKEFPEIRIDYFRHRPHEKPPLACFLSHVHSDHLAGLESLKSPFVYCSPATREIVLRLEKYPHRMNFTKGVLERHKQTYSNLRSKQLDLLKTIPLDTPTTIELRPNYEIRVTLLDANHCVGAVMFLIERESDAILYTGDIRSEPWWINRLIQNPVMLPYANCIKTLNCMYLDTTFATKARPHSIFQSKAEGLRELLKKVAQYPDDTTFYIEAWTFGYENVWIALASLLQSKIHLDRYRWSLFKSLSTTKPGAPECSEAAQLCGFRVGNHEQDGCLTDSPNVRLHSCEKGTSCPVITNNKNVVRILPIVARLPDGTEIGEMGIGGGNGDLDHIHELQHDASTLKGLIPYLVRNIKDKETLLKIYSFLSSSSHIRLDSLHTANKLEETELAMDDFVHLLAQIPIESEHEDSQHEPQMREKENTSTLPQTITFPYSRHSSYTELCELVQAFRPADVYPCTVDEKNWKADMSMQALFGYACSGHHFAHDQEMMQLLERRNDDHQEDLEETEVAEYTQNSSLPARGDQMQAYPPEVIKSQIVRSSLPVSSVLDKFCTRLDSSSTALSALPLSAHAPATTAVSATEQSSKHKRRLSSSTHVNNTASSKSRIRSVRQWAYVAATGADEQCEDWYAFGGLKCAKNENESQELS